MTREINSFQPGDFIYFPNGKKFPNGRTDISVDKIWIGAIKFWKVKTEECEDGSFYVFDTIFYSGEYPLVKVVSVTEDSYTIDGGASDMVVCEREKIDKLAELLG